MMFKSCCVYSKLLNKSTEKEVNRVKFVIRFDRINKILYDITKFTTNHFLIEKLISK